MIATAQKHTNYSKCMKNYSFFSGSIIINSWSSWHWVEVDVEWKGEKATGRPSGFILSGDWLCSVEADLLFEYSLF